LTAITLAPGDQADVAFGGGTQRHRRAGSEFQHVTAGSFVGNRSQSNLIVLGLTSRAVVDRRRRELAHSRRRRFLAATAARGRSPSFVEGRGEASIVGNPTHRIVLKRIGHHLPPGGSSRSETPACPQATGVSHVSTSSLSRNHSLPVPLVRRGRSSAPTHRPVAETPVFSWCGGSARKGALARDHINLPPAAAG
jgi:hypothetical protein